jgi:hypothetical protein
MFTPNVAKFERKHWLISSLQTRLEALQEGERQLAASENRAPCEVRLLPEEYIPQNPEDGYIAGRHGFDPNTGQETIEINPCLINNDEPYQAVNTLFHESRHAYQGHAIQDPFTKEDPEKVESWKKNLDNDVYLQPGTGQAPDLEDAYYRYQPVEADANQAAQERMDSLYQDQLQDEQGYPQYRSNKMAMDGSERLYASIVMDTDNPEEKAAQAVDQRYSQKYSQTEENKYSFTRSEPIPEQIDQLLDENEPSSASGVKESEHPEETIDRGVDERNSQIGAAAEENPNSLQQSEPTPEQTNDNSPQIIQGNEPHEAAPESENMVEKENHYYGIGY